MTAEERQLIVADVISAIRTNSVQITDLTEVLSIPEGANIELSGGKRISLDTLKSLLQTFIIDNAVEPTLANERTARQQADSDETDARQQAVSSLSAALSALQDSLSGEESARQQAISDLESIVTSLRQAIDTEAATRGTDVGNEEAARQAGDEQLTASIQEEARLRRQADEAEAAAREGRYSQLNTLVEALVQTFNASSAAQQQNVDNLSLLVSVLQQTIDSEAAIRNTADSDEATARQQADETEAAARQLADSNLSTALAALRQIVDSRENAYSELLALLQTKLDKSSVVEEAGNSSELVLSQKFVTQLLEALGTKIGRIDVSGGTPTSSGISLVFTDEDGNTKTITIPGATTVSAGAMTVADKNALNKAAYDIENLQATEITGTNLEADEESVSIEMATGDGNGYGITIPMAGTIPDGETDPVAGVMSVGQAQDLEAVVLQVFPLDVSVSSSNAGTYEKGSTVVPDITLNVTRRGAGVARSVTLDTVLHVGTRTDNTINLDYHQVSENTTFNIAVSHRGSTVNVAQQQYRFVNYVYGDVLSAAPDAASMASLLRAATTLKQLSTSTTYNGTLQAGKFFIFGVPGNVTLVCRHSETGAVISGCTTGTVQVGRQNDTATDLYSYIVVPSSDVAWNFKITNS